MLEVEFHHSVLDAGAGGSFDVVAAVVQRAYHMIAASRNIETERDHGAALLCHGGGPTAVETRSVGLSESGNTAGQSDHGDAYQTLAHQILASPQSLFIHAFPFDFHYG